MKLFGNATQRVGLVELDKMMIQEAGGVAEKGSRRIDNEGEGIQRETSWTASASTTTITAFTSCNHASTATATTPSANATLTKNLGRERSAIAVLPQQVVDQIAAGEVVQRPASVVKELLENSLDAGARHIHVFVDKGCLHKISISDNGCGIPKSDLALLATRHATSKLASVDDFETLTTFGFRGEALASTSMVSRLTVTTKHTGESVAYTQKYQNGRPTHAQPKPCARSKCGTTIVVEDLFHNVPHRQKAYAKRESEEYAKILNVVQQYAIHYPTVGFVCQRTKSSGKKGNSVSMVDCNTSQLKCVQAAAVAATKESGTGFASARNDNDDSVKEKMIAATNEVVSHVMETSVAKQLLYMECSSLSASSDDGEGGADDNINDDDDSHNKNDGPLSRADPNRHKFQYNAQIYFTPPSYESKTMNGSNNSSNKTTRFVLFLNDRIVDLPPLKRAMEGVYGDLLGGNGSSNKTVLVVKIQVPGWQVDVNVHPSKEKVSLVYQDDLIDAICRSLRERLEQEGRVFSSQSSSFTPREKSKATTRPIHNPYAPINNSNERKKRKDPELEDGDDKKDEEDDEFEEKKEASRKATPSTVSSKKKRVAPSQMIRTNKAAPAGAIEPYLIRKNSTQQLSQSQSQTSSDQQQSTQSTETPTRRLVHLPECPLSASSKASSAASPSIDMSQPGAFAAAIQNERCTCPPDDEGRRAIMIKQVTIRPKNVIPTKCRYVSIEELRSRVTRRMDKDVAKQLREAFFMGVVSHQRSLIQCGQNMILINHLEMAKDLFYQLALARFGGGAPVAQLGDGGSDGVRIEAAIAQALQLEDDLILSEEQRDLQTMQRRAAVNPNDAILKVNETNRQLARQATSCLLQHADMLEEYFSIRIERHPMEDFNYTLIHNEEEEVDILIGDKEASEAVLVGLPELLEGHCPTLHALPIFLLRLATQVNWDEEKPCFFGVCTELGNYYASLPSTDQEVEGDRNENDLEAAKQHSSFVRHHLFPALSYLLLPPKRLAKEGYFAVQTQLATLYRIFKR